ncbi:glutamate receptor ionotropic, delta-2-like [Cherax quadricarinatus]|uniref:glutamate receptor ionotropic, delta-2-like n=1 Tax=Cherax quadricarinatus TaxID=27406 RepID=UPI00387EC7E2
MFELTGGDQDGNLTQGRITRAVDYARQLRQVSWCVTAVVVSDDKDFLAAFVEVSLKGRLLVWSTRLLAVTRLPLPQLDHIHTTFSMTNSMLLVLDNLPRSLRSTVYLQLPYSPQGARMLKIAFWTPQRGLVLTSHLSLFPEKFSKFQSGASLVVVAEEYQPHAALKQGDGQGQPLSFTGPMINLLDLLAISLNFTYTFVRPPDGSWGTQQADGTWTGMVGIVKREEADIGLGPFGMSAMRAGVVDYTRPILVDYLRILGGCGRLEVDPWGFLLPLAPLVWGATMAVLLLLLVIVLMLSKYYAFDTSNLKGSSRDIYFKYLRVLLQQDTLVTAVNIWWDRVALMMWMLLMLVLSRSYCGNLMSLLAVRYIPQPYQALRLLVHSPAIMIWEASTVYVQYITSVPSGTFHDIAATRKVGRLIYQHGYEFPKSMDTVVRRGSHVIIVEDLTIKVLMAQDFSLTGCTKINNF